MFNGPPEKRHCAGSMEGEDKLLKSIRAVVQEENKALIDSFEKHITTIEARQEQLEHRIEQLEIKQDAHQET